MFLKGVAEEGGEVVTSLSLVLVVLLRFGRRGARRSARDVGAVRWIRVSLLCTPKWRAQMVWMCAKVMSLSSSRSSRIWSYGAEGGVVGGFDSSQNEGMYLKARRILPTLPKWVLTSFLELPSHVMRRPISRATRTLCMRLCLRGELGRAVFVKNGVGVGEIGSQRYKAGIYGVFKEVAFIFVHSHP
jgi:hypothetical protein